MPICLALLRAVNVGGAGRVAMSELRAFFAALGFADAETLLQTGNVVFTCAKPASAGLERHLCAEAKKRLDLETEFFLRSAEEWDELIATNPFPEAARNDPAHLLAMLLPKPPAADAVAALRAAIRDREQVEARGRTLYIVYPDGIGRSRLTGALIDAKLGMRGTGRNWNTVLKMSVLASRLR